MTVVSHPVERVRVMFDDPTLVADAGLLLPATLMVHLGLEGLINDTVRLIDRVGVRRRAHLQAGDLSLDRGSSGQQLGGMPLFQGGAGVLAGGGLSPGGVRPWPRPAVL